jgi:hypothetical protein
VSYASYPYAGAPYAGNAVVDLTPSLSLSGPSGGLVGVASTNFTITYVNPTVSLIFTPSHFGIGGGGTFSPTTLSLSVGTPSGTFTFTPATVGQKRVGGTNDGSISGPTALTYNASLSSTTKNTYAAYSYGAAPYAGNAPTVSTDPSLWLSGPGGGLPGAPATFRITYVNPVSPITFSPSDGAGGTFSPAAIALTVASPTATFTYTPTTTGGTRTLTGTNAGGVIGPKPVFYVVTTPQLFVALPTVPHGPHGVASGNFTFSISSPLAGITTVTPVANASGTWNPTTVALSSAVLSATATFTPLSAGSIEIRATGNNSAATSAPVIYVSDGLVFYISAAGNDANDGQSPATPWLSAAQIMSYGVRRGGVYNFHGGDTFANVQIVVNDSNNGLLAGDLITFQSYGTGKAILRQLNSNIVPMKGTSCGGIKVKNLTLEGYGFTPTASTQGLVLFDGVGTLYNLSVIDCELKNAFYGVAYAYDSSAVVEAPTITGCEFHHLIGIGTLLQVGSNPVGGVYPFRNAVITGNTYRDIDGNITAVGNQQAVAAYVRDTNGCEWSGNLVHDIAATTVNGGAGLVTTHVTTVRAASNEIYNISGPGAMDAFGIDFDYSTRNSVAEFNYIHDLQSSGLVAFEYVAGSPLRPAGDPVWLNNTFRYNVIQNCASTHAGAFGFHGDNLSGVFVYNNTFVTTAGGSNYQFWYETAAGHAASNALNVRVYNNIFLSNTAAVKLTNFPAVAGTNAEQHWLNNLYYVGGGDPVFDWRGVTYTGLAAWQVATGQDLSALGTNPLLTDAFTAVIFNDASLITTLDKVTPLSNSPVINAGLNLTQAPYSYTGITSDFAGKAVPFGSNYDIGAIDMAGGFLVAWAVNANAGYA